MALQHADRPRPPHEPAAPRETAVAQVMTSTSVGKHPTAFNATGLPILRIALDVSAMTPALEPLLSPLMSAGQQPRLSYARLLAYKAGNRGTIRYDVEANGTVTVLGKLYPEPRQAERVFAILDRLWRDVFQTTSDLAVPRPLGVVAELAMLVYIPVEGQALDEFLISATGTAETGRPGVGATHLMSRTAAWIAALHGSPLELDRRLQLDTEIVNLHAWAALVARAHPEHADPVGRLASGLASTAAVARTATNSPIHKDFHYRHVLVDDGVGVIDLDEVRYGDPMYDVAHFCAHLRLLAARHGTKAAEIAEGERAFVRAYTDVSGRSLGDSFPWFAAYTCVKIAKQLCSLRGVRPHPDGGDQADQLAVMLDQGMAFHGDLR